MPRLAILRQMKVVVLMQVYDGDLEIAKLALVSFNKSTPGIEKRLVISDDASDNDAGGRLALFAEELGWSTTVYRCSQPLGWEGTLYRVTKALKIGREMWPGFADVYVKLDSDTLCLSPRLPELLAEGINKGAHMIGAIRKQLPRAAMGFMSDALPLGRRRKVVNGRMTRETAWRVGSLSYGSVLRRYFRSKNRFLYVDGCFIAMSPDFLARLDSIGMLPFDQGEMGNTFGDDIVLSGIAYGLGLLVHDIGSSAVPDLWTEHGSKEISRMLKNRPDVCVIHPVKSPAVMGEVLGEIRFELKHDAPIDRTDG